MCLLAAKLQKNTLIMNFFRKKFAQFRKTPYLCTRLTAKPASVAQLVRAPDC